VLLAPLLLIVPASGVTEPEPSVPGGCVDGDMHTGTAARHLETAVPGILYPHWAVMS